MPQDLLAQIRQYGGKMKETYGVPVDEIQEAIKYGVRKINIDTDIRLAMTGAVRKFLAENPEQVRRRASGSSRRARRPSRSASSATCEFGCEGQAAKIKPQTLARGGAALRQRRAGADGGLSCAAGRSAEWRCIGSMPRDRSHLLDIPSARPSSLPLLARGKVRDNYAVGDDRLLMVASDRLSAFDVVMGEPIPGKGELLTRMALFWFARLRGIVPNHLTGDDPESVVAPDERDAGARPLDAGQAPEAAAGRGRGARLPGRQRLEGVPADGSGLRRHAAGRA